ncbi:MAG: hypothetical protein KatS3mg083_277 [Candidatus Dojkabacteria bacterium]|nr:MAG: hypothetical protein KatS3mg083_277 [Candidatus Dojkabacteria bacterium]
MDVRIKNLLDYVEPYMNKDGKIYRVKPEEMVKYYLNDAMSQTYLKALKKSLYKYLKAKEKRVTEPMLLGRLVDSMLTSTIDDFNAEFCIVTGDVIPDVNVIELMLEKFDPSIKFEDIPKDVMVRFIRDHNIFSRTWKDDTVYEKMKLIYEDFWNTCVHAGGYRIPVPFSLYDKALKIATIAKQKPVWHKLHQADLILYQVPLYNELDNGMRLKSLLDMVIIPNVDLPHVHVVDIKTTNGDILDFPKIYTKLNYGFQAKFYTMMLHRMFGIPVEGMMFSFYVVTDYTACLFKGPVYTPEDGEVDLALTIYKWYLDTGFKEDYLVAKSDYYLMADFYQDDLDIYYED